MSSTIKFTDDTSPLNNFIELIPGKGTAILGVVEPHSNGCETLKTWCHLALSL